MRVPIDADPRQRAWRQLMAHVGLPESTPMLVQRVASAGIGISPAIGREVDPPPRPRPPAEHMRSERTTRTAAKRIWPNLAKGRR